MTNIEQLKEPLQSVKNSVNKETPVAAISGPTIGIRLPDGTTEPFEKADKQLVELLLETFQKHTSITPEAVDLSRPKFEKRITGLERIMLKHGLYIEKLGGKGGGGGRNPSYSLKKIKETAPKKSGQSEIRQTKASNGAGKKEILEPKQITLPDGQTINDEGDRQVYSVLNKLIKAFATGEQVNRNDFREYSHDQLGYLMRKTKLLLKKQVARFKIKNQTVIIPKKGLMGAAAEVLSFYKLIRIEPATKHSA